MKKKFLFISLAGLFLMSFSKPEIKSEINNSIACCSAYVEFERETIEMVRVCHNRPDESEIMNTITACAKADEILEMLLPWDD